MFSRLNFIIAQICLHFASRASVAAASTQWIAVSDVTKETTTCKTSVRATCDTTSHGSDIFRLQSLWFIEDNKEFRIDGYFIGLVRVDHL